MNKKHTFFLPSIDLKDHCYTGIHPDLAKLDAQTCDWQSNPLHEDQTVPKLQRLYTVHVSDLRNHCYTGIHPHLPQLNAQTCNYYDEAIKSLS